MSHRLLSAVFALCLLAAACSDGPVGSGRTEPTISTTASPVSATTLPPARPPFCADRIEGRAVGTVASDELDEISGAAVSRSRPGVLWFHNDSGNEPILYAATTEGDDIGRVTLEDLEARDWEDMAIGPGPDPTLDYLYIADIGDNSARRDEVRIHRIPEPGPGVEIITGGETLVFTYPTGPTEAETLLVDPIGGDMVIAGKTLSGVTPLFALAGDIDWGVPHVATYLGEIRLGSFAVATGGDAGRDDIVIRTYDEVFAWRRTEGQSLAEVVLTPSCRIAAIDEDQGEAIALAADGSFYTVSEGLHQPIYRFSAGG